MYWYFDFSSIDCNSAQRKLFISIISVNVILNPRHQVQRLMHWPSFAHSQTIAALALIIVAAVAAGSILYPPIFSYDTVADSWHSSSKFNWFNSNFQTILIGIYPDIETITCGWILDCREAQVVLDSHGWNVGEIQVQQGTIRRRWWRWIQWPSSRFFQQQRSYRHCRYTRHRVPLVDGHKKRRRFSDARKRRMVFKDWIYLFYRWIRHRIGKRLAISLPV